MIWKKNRIPLGLTIVLYVAVIAFVRKFVHAQTRGLMLSQAKQMSDNMVANEIAKRVAVCSTDECLCVRLLASLVRLLA